LFGHSAALFNESREVAFAGQAGFRAFTAVAELKHYFNL
jgi:hypothetical protein